MVILGNSDLILNLSVLSTSPSTLLAPLSTSYLSMSFYSFTLLFPLHQHPHLHSSLLKKRTVSSEFFSTDEKDPLSLAQNGSKSFSPSQGIVSILPGLPVLLTACSPHSSKGPLRPGICELLGHAGDLCAKHEVGHARAEAGPVYMPADML